MENWTLYGPQLQHRADHGDENRMKDTHMNTHDNEHLAKLKQHEQRIDELQEMHEPLVHEDQIDFDIRKEEG